MMFTTTIIVARKTRFRRQWDINFIEINQMNPKFILRFCALIVNYDERSRVGLRLLNSFELGSRL